MADEKPPKLVKCPLCKGEKRLPRDHRDARYATNNPERDCVLCEGKGKIRDNSANAPRLGR